MILDGHVQAVIIQPVGFSAAKCMEIVIGIQIRPGKGQTQQRIAFPV
jgi:hypothetical protein